MEIKIVERLAFAVAGLKHTGKNESNEIPQLWQALMPRAGEIKNLVENAAAYGVSANMDMETGEFDYFAGFEVSSAQNLPPGMVAFKVPGGRYAVFPTTLPQIGETYQNIFKTWLPEAGLQATGAPDFELYDEQFNAQDPSSVLYLYIPIE
jgi:AraC family transcriptional regulator